MSARDALLDRLPRWVLVGGKGGVGKTTCAASLASRSGARGTRTLLLSTDPAGALGDVLGAPLGATPRAIREHPGVFAFQLDPAGARDAFLARWRETLVAIIDRGTYLERPDVEGLVDAAFPGIDEAMAMLALASLEGEEWERIVVDTAPTGHTLRLLALPDTFRALVGLLDLMQAKHRFMVSALTHRYRADEADAFLSAMTAQVGALQAVLRDASRAAMVLVARPEEVVVAETERYASELGTLGVHVGALVVNAVPSIPSDGERESMVRLATLGADVPHYAVPRLTSPPHGTAGLAGWGEAMERLAPAAGAKGTERRAGPPPRHHDHSAGVDSSHPSSATQPRSSPEIRPLTIVGGKGGVGKTTVACALALFTAGVRRRVLLVSTDPAPSVADALAQPIGDEETPVEGASGLDARQMDAAAAFARLRDEYRARIDAVFDGILGGGMDATHDRRIIRDLLALAPPGIDEVYALSLLGEAQAEGRYDTIIVDPAPTGHLLRLLEMPALALEWSHRLMRLMLKYKELAGLGDAAQELLAFARRTRLVEAMLREPAEAGALRRSGFLAVALDEPIVRSETVRLVEAVRGQGVDVSGIIWNRETHAPAALPLDAPPPQFLAAPLSPSPRGVPALRAWHAGWTALDAGA